MDKELHTLQDSSASLEQKMLSDNRSTLGFHKQIWKSSPVAVLQQKYSEIIALVCGYSRLWSDKTVGLRSLALASVAAQFEIRL